MVMVGFWQNNSILYFHLPGQAFHSVYLCSNFPFFTRTLATVLGPILLQYDLVLTCSHLQTPYFQLRQYSQVLGGHEFKGNLSCQYIPFSVKLTKLNIKNPTYIRKKTVRRTLCTELNIWDLTISKIG